MKRDMSGAARNHFDQVDLLEENPFKKIFPPLSSGYPIGKLNKPRKKPSGEMIVPEGHPPIRRLKKPVHL